MVAVVSLLTLVALLAGCSLIFGGSSSEEPTPVPDDRVIVPTFTPTTEVPATDTPGPTQEPTAVLVEATAAEVAEAADVEEATAEAPVTLTVEVASPTPLPKVIVSAASANTRSGPGTDFGLVGAVNQGQTFDVIGKNADGTWWQFCCVNGQPAWVFGELVSVENSDLVPVAQDIPAAPVAAAPARHRLLVATLQGRVPRHAAMGHRFGSARLFAPVLRAP